MAKKGWNAFAYPNKAYDYSGSKLAKVWPKLHAGSCEPFPDEKRVAHLLKAHPSLGTDPAAIAAQLQDAWRAFHRGEFQRAYELGIALGPMGASLAIKAGGVHASYLLDNESEQIKRYEGLIRIAEESVEAQPDEPNAYYPHAYAIGRYSQLISITTALKQGLAGKVRTSLERTLELQPDHAEASTALGLFHAEIVGKLGSMLARLTYGASAAEAEKYLRRGVELIPDAPIGWIEYGRGLLLLHGEKAEDQVAEAFDTAAKLKPRDAMEDLDSRWAREQIE
ncbi:MAG: hypothetical protein ABIY56_10920 [Dokdonella sp.]